MLVFPDFYLVKLKYLKPPDLAKCDMWMALCPSDRLLTALFLLEQIWPRARYWPINVNGGLGVNMSLILSWDLFLSSWDGWDTAFALHGLTCNVRWDWSGRFSDQAHHGRGEKLVAVIGVFSQNLSENPSITACPRHEIGLVVYTGPNIPALPSSSRRHWLAHWMDT